MRKVESRSARRAASARQATLAWSSVYGVKTRAPSALRRLTISQSHMATVPNSEVMTRKGSRMASSWPSCLKASPIELGEEDGVRLRKGRAERHGREDLGLVPQQHGEVGKLGAEVVVHAGLEGHWYQASLHATSEGWVKRRSRFLFPAA